MNSLPEYVLGREAIAEDDSLEVATERVLLNDEAPLSALKGVLLLFFTTIPNPFLPDIEAKEVDVDIC